MEKGKHFSQKRVSFCAMLLTIFKMKKKKQSPYTVQHVEEKSGKTGKLLCALFGCECTFAESTLNAHRARWMFQWTTIWVKRWKIWYIVKHSHNCHISIHMHTYESSAAMRIFTTATVPFLSKIKEKNTFFWTLSKTEF